MIFTVQITIDYIIEWMDYMYTVNFEKPIWIHFIGIGGISMSGLAEILLEKGFTVTGSDLHRTPVTEHLESLGVRISYEQKAENILPGTDLIVYTAAVHADNPEYSAALSSGIPVMDRATLLGQIMSHYANSIAVSGTHGKTTTTSMLSHIFIAAQKDPTVTVGGVLKGIHGNIRLGHSDNFIAEACEYTNSFLKFNPHIELILNIDADHLDFFKDLNDIRHSFRLFAQKQDKDDILVINGEIPDLDQITCGLPCKIITFGMKDSCDYCAKDIDFDENGNPAFDVFRCGKYLRRVQLRIPGVHNIFNALAAIATADELGISMEAVQDGLDHFTGTDRRFEHKGFAGGVEIIDDYAHHPTEISATLEAAQRYPHRSIWCVFQPHTYSRTRSLKKEFAEALSAADHVVLAKIYPAREEDPGNISSGEIRAMLEEMGCDAYYFDTFEAIEKFLLKKCVHGDLLITMGAGNVVNIGEDLLK